MKKLTLLFLMSLFTMQEVAAQTDVTDKYLTNAGFDVEADFVSSIVYTYASDANQYGGVSSCQPVTGWTADATGDGKAGGSFRYGSGFGLAGNDYKVPSTDAQGNSLGGALGLAGCWGNAVGYSQALTLPAGTYRISYSVYNAGTNTIANYDNKIGFVESSSATHYADIEFYVGEWTEGVIYLSLKTETSGTFQVGYACANIGSGGTPKLFVDYVRIESLDDAYVLEDKTSLVAVDKESWGGGGIYKAEDVTATETFQWAASLPLGERLGQTVSGLPNGVYSLSMYVAVSSTSGRDNTGNVIVDGSTQYASFHANNISHAVPAYNRENFDKFDRIELNDIYVTDGKLKLYLNQDMTGPNWLAVQVKRLTRVSELPRTTYTIGDVNKDNDVTISDVTQLVNIILGRQENYDLEVADMNEDGEVTISDVTQMVNVILGRKEAKVVDNNYLYADLNAIVYAEQSAAENSNASYMLNTATGILNNADVSLKYDMRDYVTTLNLTTTFDNVASISVYALDKTAIAGPMTILNRGGKLKYTYTAGDELTYANSLQSDVVTVTGTTDGAYVAYLRPVTLGRGVKVTVRTTDGKYYSQDFTDISAGKVNNLSFTQNTAANLWMATIPSNTYFSMLSTPGAHDAATKDCSSVAKCQSEDLAGLLANGVRAFDFRPRYTSNSQSDIELNNLEIYHGSVATGVKFKDAIDILINFVKENPSEAVSVIMQKENSKLIFSLTDQSETWRASIRECFSDASRAPYLMGSVRGYHTLGDVRGKVSIVSKNPYGNSEYSYRDVIYGAVIEKWPDDGVVTDYSCDMTQAWNWVDCRASVEDAYNSSTDTKKSQVETQLKLANANTDHTHYNYTFTSIANSITSSANTMNNYTANTLIPTLTGPLCYVYADFMGSSDYYGSVLLKAVIEQNYKYVFKGRSRVE